LEKEIKEAIRGVSDYFEINKDGNEIRVNPHSGNRKNARLRDGKCLIFTTNYIFICYLAYLALARYKHHLGVTGWA
jgi:hypothetical protein